jgi:F420-dependent oxidoreductase-like protein
MKLGLMVGYSGARVGLDVAGVLEAERLGYDSVWTAEAWGSDAVSPLAWLGAKTSRIRLGTAVMQLPGRSPANTAMTAMTLDALSGGRHILGLGTSGPQVVEGWHGVPWDRPLTWMREYIAIVRQIFARQAPFEFEGERYQIPYRGPGSQGLGKPLKSILHGRADIPIFAGSMAPKGQALAAELCDGVLLTCMNPERPEVVERNLQEGLARRTDGRTRAQLEVAPVVAVCVGDDLEACRAHYRPQLALYLGGMGAREKNFYKEYVMRAGFEAEADRVQELWCAGQKQEAMAAVPDAMIDALYLVGSKERIRDRFQVWKASGVSTLLVGAHQPEAVRLLAELNA